MKKSARAPRLRRVAVLGRGKAGGSLVRTLRDAGVVVDVHGRRFSPAFAARAARCDVLFLAVPDRALADVAASLAARPALPPLVVHMAGALDLQPLAALRGAARTASFHPLDALDGKTPIAKHTLVAIDADDERDVGALAALAKKLKLHPARVRARDRVRYHAGAVVAANLATALLALGIELLVESGVGEDVARHSLARLLQSTARNAEHHALAIAMTGPVARGDDATIAKHLALLQTDHPRTAAIYDALTSVLRGIQSANGQNHKHRKTKR